MLAMRLFGKSGLALVAASAFLPGSANGLEASIKQVSCGSCEYLVTLTPTEAQLGAQIGISISTSGAFGEYKADQTVSSIDCGCLELVECRQLRAEYSIFTSLSHPRAFHPPSTRLTATWTVPFTTNADATALFAVLDAGGTFFVDPTTGSSSTSQVSEAVDLSACTTTTTTSSTTTTTNTSRTTPTSTRSTIASPTSGTFVTVTTGAPASTSSLPSSGSDQSNGGGSNVGAIAGGAVGGILVSALSGFLLLFC